MPDYRLVKTADDFRVAAGLFREYATSIGIDLGFQGFEKELSVLDTMYAEPEGGIILCRENETDIGCVAIRKLEGEVAELKRMYLKPLHQGKGYGRELMEKAIGLAKELGYRKVRLDTLDTMLPAIHLYKSYGFREITPYYHNPFGNAVYFEKNL